MLVKNVSERRSGLGSTSTTVLFKPRKIWSLEKCAAVAPTLRSTGLQFNRYNDDRISEEISISIVALVKVGSGDIRNSIINTYKAYTNLYKDQQIAERVGMTDS